MNDMSGNVGRSLADQTVLDLPDSKAVDAPLRASVIFALRVYNSQILEGQLRGHIARALTAETVGQIRTIIAAADRLLRK